LHTTSDKVDLNPPIDCLCTVSLTAVALPS
jgi:hypothetical protein